MTMRNIDQLIRLFPMQANKWKRKRKETKEICFEEKENWKTRNIDKICTCYQIVFWFSIVAEVIALFTCEKDWISLKCLMIIMYGIVGIFILFYFVFADVISFTRDKDKKSIVEQWKINKIYFTPTIVVFGLSNIIISFSVISIDAQCSKGTKSEIIVGTIIYMIFIIAAIARNWKQLILYPTLTIGMTLMVGSYVALSFMSFFFYINLGEATHYKAEILDTNVSSSSRGGTHYSAKVVLPDGQEMWIETTKHIYNDIQLGKDVVVCERDSAFDTTYVRIHE